MKHHGQVLGVVLGLCVGWPGPGLAAQTGAAPGSAPPAAADPAVLYDLRAERAWSVGDAYRWSANEYERTTITWGEGEDAEVESDTYLTYGIVANSQVNEVDDDHHVTAVTHQIERLYLVEDELLPPGTVLVATRSEDETVYTVGEDRIENETLLYVLNQVANLHIEPTRDYNTLLRVPEAPQPVGARWEIDGPAFARAMADERIRADASDASGEVHFARAMELYGVPGLAFELRFVLDGIDPVFEEAYPEHDLLENTLVIEAELMGPQSDEHLAQGVELNARLTQSWHDPASDRDMKVMVYSELSAGQRELTEQERGLLGFD